MSARRPIIVLIAGFALLGAPGAALGVAWPSIADELQRNLGDLGILTLVTGLAYATMSLIGGPVSKRYPAGRLLVVMALVGAVGLVLYAVGDQWWVLVLASIPIGVAGGSLDSLGNSYVAVEHGPREMGAIHAAFGFGSMVAPLGMTALLTVGVTWRAGFGVLALAQVLLGIGLAGIAAAIRMPMEGKVERPVRGGSRLLLGASVWTFFVYAGVEGSIGFWAFTLLTEGQGVAETVAGIGVAVHWGALFASRVLIGVVGDRVPIDPTIRVSVLGIVLGLTLVWWNPSTAASLAGLALAGFCSGPVFPLEVLLTTPRFGADFTPWAVGYQLGAAIYAVALVPAAIGALVNASGPLVIGAALTVLAVIVVVSVEVLRWLTDRSAREPTGSVA